RVNGRLVPLRYKLKNGDMVEVITSPSQTPSKDWLSIVGPGRAKNPIRAYIRTEERRRSSELGKELIDKDLRRYGTTLKKFLESKELQAAAAGARCSNPEELFIQIGYGKVLPSAVTEHLVPKESREESQ